MVEYEKPRNQVNELMQVIREKESDLNLLRDNVFELQGQLQNAYIRIKELREKLDGDTD